MGQVPGWLWPISLLLPVGVFVDFLLGKKGRENIIRVLEDWWTRFDDVTKHNFGKKEGLFAVSTLDCIIRLVVITPGAMQFTVIPRSWARYRV